MVEKIELKEVVATVVAGKEAEATKMAMAKVATKFPKKPLRSSFQNSPKNSLKVLKFHNSSSSQILKFSSPPWRGSRYI